MGAVKRTTATALALLTPLTGWIASCAGEPIAPDGPPRAADANVHDFGDAREIETRDGAYVISWRPVDGEIPINEGFEVEVRLARNDAARTPVAGAQISMTCFMPDHGHGMLREPRSREIGGGEYLVEGLLLHMDGFWTVAITALEDSIASTADDELRL